MRRCLTILLLLCAVAGEVGAQTMRVTAAQENLRATPGGLVLGVVRQGTALQAGELRGRWRQGTLEGWMWSASLASATTRGFQLQVSASDGENLRAEPGGGILGRLEVGTLLEMLERRGAWVRVRRTGWIWAASMALDGTEPAGREPEASDTAGASGRAPTELRGTVPGPKGALERMLAPRGAVLRAAPGGDSVGALGDPAAVEVMEREGGWARVRLEGWMPVAVLSGVDAAEEVLHGVGLAELREAPESYRGRLIEWEVQFISLEEADEVRTEFAPGEHYLLARGPGEEPGFVYVAVQEASLPAVRRLASLQRIGVVGRVRVARSPLTGAPVLELVELKVRPRQ